MKKYLLIASLSFLGFGVNAQQKKTSPLSASLMEELQGKAEQRIKNFCLLLSDLSSSKISDKRKESLENDLLKLFLDEATMQVKTVNDKETISGTAPIKDYLDGVRRYKDKYDFVLLEYEMIVVDLSKMKDTTIKVKPAKQGKFSFVQRMKVQNWGDAAKDGKQPTPGKEIVDVSDKYGKLYIIYDKEPFKLGSPYKILLGDIKVAEVKITKKSMP